MIANMFRRWGVAVLLGAACCGSSFAQSVDTRCIKDGGIAQCPEPVIVPSPPGAAVDSQMWRYAVCDVAGCLSQFA